MIPTLPARSRLAGLVAARGTTAQLYAYAAVLAGAKPTLDDWVDVPRVQVFLAECRKLGLAVATDVVFEPLGDFVVDGRDRLCTTRARALAWRAGGSYPKGSQLHVFVGRDPDRVEKTWRHGWYALVVEGHVAEPEPGDLIEFGRALGYPDCCIKAFATWCDWQRCNAYEVALIATRGEHSRLANPCGRHSPYGYVFHVPCRFDCDATKALGRAVRDAMASFSPEWVQEAEAFHDRLFLVTNENRVYGLQSRSPAAGVVHYRSATFLGGLAEEDLYGPILARGTEILIDGHRIVVSSNGHVVGVIETRSDIPGPERPMIFAFPADRYVDSR